MPTKTAVCLLNFRLIPASKKEKYLISFEKAGLNLGGRFASRVDSLGKNYLIVDNTVVNAQKTVKNRVEVYRSLEFNESSNAKAGLLVNCCRVYSFRH